MKTTSLQCPECKAPIDFEFGNRDIIFCPYCGTKIYLDDEVHRMELNINKIYREIDEARIAEAEISREIERDKIAHKERMKQSNNKTIALCICGLIVTALIISIGIVSVNGNKKTSNVTMQATSETVVKLDAIPTNSAPVRDEVNVEQTAVIELPVSNQTNASVAAESDFLYVNNGSEVQINGYQGNGGFVKIPDEIEGVPVTRIATNAFNKAENITGLSLPNMLQYIGDSAFHYMKNLTGVLILPETVTEVDGHAFQSTGLTGLVIQSSCKLNVNAFANITSLEFIYIAEGCAPVIGTSVFSYAEALTRVVVPSDVYSIKDGTFSACNTAVFYTPEGSVAEEYAKSNFIRSDTANYEKMSQEFAKSYK